MSKWKSFRMSVYFVDGAVLHEDISARTWKEACESAGVRAEKAAWELLAERPGRAIMTVSVSRNE